MNSNCQLVQQTPYNPTNQLINKDDVLKFLSIFDDITNINIYRRAFVHKSYCTRKNENYNEGNINCPDDCLPLQEESNERLEFLGDAILNFVVGKYLFERYPTVNEGFLTTTRTKLVNGEMLASLSAQIGLGKYILLSSQIESNNGRSNKNILEDTFEAFIGSIFFDYEEKDGSGFKHADEWIVHILEEYVDFSDLMTQNKNYKDTLVKYCQHNFQFIPKFYEIDVSENKNGKCYTIYVKNNLGSVMGIGKGTNKKNAEIDAAKKALKYFNA
jgi:ribonuclease-3